MDTYLEEDKISDFRIEVHGIKSVMKNIGAASLGNVAAKLESSAIENNKEFCDENYPLFKTALLKLMEQLNSVLSEDSQGEKDKVDKEELIKSTEIAKSAIECFDRDQALKILTPYTNFTLGEDADNILKEIIFALDAFDCENAQKLLTSLEEKINSF